MLETWNNLLGGFATTLTPDNLFYCFVGVFLGTVVGILPGLGPLTTIAILLPYSQSPHRAESPDSPR